MRAAVGIKVAAIRLSSVLRIAYNRGLLVECPAGKTPTGHYKGG